MILRNAVSSLISVELGGFQHFQNLGQEYFLPKLIWLCYQQEGLFLMQAARNKCTEQLLIKTFLFSM